MPEENVKYYTYWVNASEAHLQPYFNCTVVGWTSIAAQLSSLAIMCWTLWTQQFFSLSLKHKPTASAQNKLRGSEHGRTPARCLFSPLGWREGRHTIKGITHPDSSGQVCHVLRSILPPGCASKVRPGSTSLASRTSRQALCGHVSTLSASHGSGSR